jgi:hypothetical protein
MTGARAERFGVSAFAVSAGLVFGAAVLLAFRTLPEGGVQVLVAIGVAAGGLGLVLLPGGPPARRAVGGGLLVFGALLLAGALLVAMGTVIVVLPGIVVTLLGNGLVTLALLGLAATGARVWVAGAGVFLAMTTVAVLLGLPVDRGVVAVVVLVLAVPLTAVVAASPAGSTRGDLAGAAAATTVTFAYGAGTSPVASFLPLAWFTYDGGQPQAAGALVRACALLVVVVLVVLAALRRDPATGFLAALVFVVPAGDAVLAAPLALAAAVALLALRLPAVRAALARVPAASREDPPSGALTAACAAAVAAAALVAIALVALPDRPLTGVLALVAVAVAGALAHFLPAPAGAALAVVALVGLALTRPWHLLAADALAGPSALVTAAAAIWPLTRRHPTPAVVAAAAYLLLTTLPRLAVLDDAPLVVLLLPLVLLGVPAAVFALHPRTADGTRAAAQAAGAVVLGAAILVPWELAHRFAVGEPTGEAFDPLTPTDAWGAASHVRDHGQAAAVVLVLLALAFALAVATARRPSMPLAVAAALGTYSAVDVAGVLVGEPAGAIAPALVVAAAALAAAAWFAHRRAAAGPSRDRFADR